MEKEINSEIVDYAPKGCLELVKYLKSKGV